jgi:hypothetical protein
MRWVTNSSCKGEREKEEGRRFFFGSAKRRPERTKSPREQGSHLGLNLQGAEIRLFSWDKVAGAPGRGSSEVLQKAQERNGWVETPDRITKKEQSFAGRSPRVLDPEKGIQGLGELRKPLRG